MKDIVKANVVKSLKNKMKAKKSLSLYQVYQSHAEKIKKRQDGKTTYYFLALIALSFLASLIYFPKSSLIVISLSFLILVCLFVKNIYEIKFVNKYFDYFEFDLVKEYKDSIDKFILENPDKIAEKNEYETLYKNMNKSSYFRSHVACDIFLCSINKKDKSLDKVNQLY